MTLDRSDPHPTDIYMGFYHVKIDYAAGHKPSTVDLYDLAEALPHGSGIDGDWHVTVKRNGDVLVRGEYHAMDTHGYYNGWRNFRFTLYRAVRNKYVSLKGPCEGQFQVTLVKGKVYFGKLLGGGDAADYLYQSCYWPLADKLNIHAIEPGNVTVNSEGVARSYTG